MQYVPKNWQEMRNWLETPLGKQLIRMEIKQLQDLLPRLFGYHLLVLGEPQFARCLESSPIGHQVLIHPIFSRDTHLSTICARQDKLPIANDEIDMVYLPYVLGSLINPIEVLSEVYRVLRAEGHIVVSCFNPWSTWGIWKLIACWKGGAPWSDKFISLPKMRHWLMALNFDVMWVRNFNFYLPVSYGSWRKKFSSVEKLAQSLGLPLGGSYVIVASKRVVPLTPIRPFWASNKERTIESDLAEPSV